MATSNYLKKLNKWQACSHPDLADRKPEELFEAPFAEREIRTGSRSGELRQTICPQLPDHVRRSGSMGTSPPGPELPDEIVANNAAKYREAQERLTP